MDKDGNVLRHKNLTEAQALTVASAFFSVTHRAMHAVRDMDPEDSLSFVRIRMKTMEVIAAPGPNFLVLALQSWTPHSWAAMK
ncbi:hypothetical protein FNF29_05069 [Cafeteria roenbergensis]|nr:hypothetical protein FNF29_05069 [Cafeteria roenbergensis]KAA0168806.1 hypothetical protein FNF28_02353 [Cafeteria roenbergensis]|eukprot:KAA0150732.1 hypothetical protein FNF29_05069 [Cafeteria roenbergensis]